MFLTQRFPEQSNTLAACAVVLFAATLDQGTLTVLKTLINQYAATNLIDTDSVPFSRVVKESLKNRIMKLPSIVTEAKYCLRSDIKEVEHLYAIVTTRNNLVHIQDDIRLIYNPEVKYVEEKGVFQTVIKHPNPWKDVTLNKVKQYYQSFRTYYNQVLFPSYEIPDSKLLQKNNKEEKNTYYQIYLNALSG